MRINCFCVTLGAVIGFSFGGDRCAATLTVECIVVDGPNVIDGNTFELECFVSSDVTQIIRGSRIDIPCILSGQPSTEGFITVVGFTADRDGDGAKGPSSEGVPYLYGPNGSFSFELNTCAFAGILHTGSPVTLVPGAFRYLGTVQLQVSVCALGDFSIIVENFTDPPQESNGTKFRDDNAALIPLLALQTTLTVSTSACCLSEQTCANLGTECCWYRGGIPGPNGSDCEIELDDDGDDLPNVCDPCPTDILNDSDNDGVCDSVDLCPGEDDSIDANNDQVPDCLQKIPTTTAWGIVVLALCLSIAAKVFHRKWLGVFA